MMPNLAVSNLAGIVRVAATRVEEVTIPGRALEREHAGAYDIESLKDKRSDPARLLGDVVVCCLDVWPELTLGQKTGLGFLLAGLGHRDRQAQREIIRELRWRHNVAAKAGREFSWRPSLRRALQDPDAVAEVRKGLTLLASQSEQGPKDKFPKQKRRKRGRPSDTDPKKDKRLYDAWQTGHYNTFSDLAREKRMEKRDVKLAIDRHRHRLKRT